MITHISIKNYKSMLEERLRHLESEDEHPLGALWYSGFVGGVPKKGA
jgi:AAA15 family ATPase/GTPase